MHAASDQQPEAEAPEESPPNEKCPPVENGEATTGQLPTDLTRKAPYNLDEVSLTLEIDSSNDKHAPTPALIRD